MASKRNKKVDTSETKTSPKKGGSKKKGGGGGSRRYDVVQKSIAGSDQTIGTFESQSGCQRKIEEMVAQSNGSLKLHDFEIVPSK